MQSISFDGVRNLLGLHSVMMVWCSMVCRGEIDMVLLWYSILWDCMLLQCTAWFGMACSMVWYAV